MTQARPSGKPQRLAGFLAKAFTREINKFRDQGEVLQALWREAVDVNLADGAHPVSLTAGRLLVNADTPAVGSRIRQQQNELIARLRRKTYFQGLIEIKVRIVPVANVTKEVQSGTLVLPSSLSAATARVIRDTASHVTDPNLRAALERLAAEPRAKAVHRSRPTPKHPTSTKG